MDVTERVATVLACAALDPQLSGLLLLDLDPVLLLPVAAWLADLIGGQPPVLDLGVKHTEEAIWGHPVPAWDETDPVRWAPGVLDGHERRPAVITVADLSRLSLPAARAAVAAIGADVVHLERSQQSSCWRPRDRWLATLRRADAGTVSPHLLDRFGVRVDAADLAAELRGRGQRTLPSPAPPWRRAVRAGRLPGFGGEAAERVAVLLPGAAPGLRRDLALARMARALAGLESEPETRPGHVDRAAALVGLWPAGGEAISSSRTPSFPTQEPRLPPDLPRGPRSRPPEPPAEPDSADDSVAPPSSPNAEGFMKVAPGDGPEPLPSTPAEGLPGRSGPGESRPPVSGGPYPEDDAVPRRVADPLRLGWQRGPAGLARGYPIGTERARDLSDIAVVATLLEALTHQVQRCPTHYQEGHPLHVRVEDLRSYRRVRWAGHLLVLVLDHTCRAVDWDWLVPLAPYLSWAYATRAQVGVVEVGAAVADSDPVSELRATEFRVRNLLDPRVQEALEPRPGRATPLAHGLTLAAAVLRHDTQQGSAPVIRACLVVVTDGRANVPLADSQLGMPPTRVGPRAVHDAENVARAIRRLHRVQSVVIDPGPHANGYLATRLAAQLGAPIKHASPDARHGTGAA